MSSARGGDKRTRGQAHQNTFAFRPNKNSTKTKQINAIPVGGTCRRCTDMIEWRKKYHKYKPITQPKRCVSCSEKKVKLAYHVWCDSCASERQICPKCGENRELIPGTQTTNAEDIHELVAGMKERKRRTILRKYEQGELNLEDIMAKAEESDTDSESLLHDTADEPAENSSADGSVSSDD
mmetsp:Transcript_5026/g.8751  ORF Transcript_5026/g.8751 Transcript_5026/m.8751 type:complete len:181 (-) Transcript_5026:776-1318(-)